MNLGFRPVRVETVMQAMETGAISTTAAPGGVLRPLTTGLGAGS